MSWLAWFAALLFWLAIAEYAKKWTSTRRRKYAMWGVLPIAMALGTSYLVREKPESLKPTVTFSAVPLEQKMQDKKHNIERSINTNFKKQSAAPASKPSISARDSGTAVGSISQSNSGGNNVQQNAIGGSIIDSPVTIGNVPKRIPPPKIPAMKAYLAEAPNKARIIIYVEPYGEVALANDLYALFRDAGWPMEHNGVEDRIGSPLPGQDFKGVVVTMKGEPLPMGGAISFPNRDPAIYIAKVLDELQVPRSFNRRQDVPEGVIALVLRTR